MSYSVLRRYTPPTCALEILAKHSPLSRWAGRTVLKDVRFNLSLDDPKLPPEQWIALRGDRAQLEALQEAVQSYVQNLLEQTHDRLAASSPPASGVAVATETRTPIVNPAGILLQPRGLLAHDLILGSLQAEGSGSTVQLSTLQLFDLANALDESSVDLLTLPALPRSNWLVTSPAWAKIAAVSLLVVGVSASIVKVLDAPYSPTTASSPNSSQGASSTDQRIATQIPPTATPASPQPLATTKPLTTPPTPPIGSAVPSTGLPGNPGLPTLTIPQDAPVNSAPTGNQAESTIVVPPNPSGGEPEPKPAPQPIAEAPSADRVDSSSLATAAPSVSSGATSARSSRDPASSAFDTIPQVAEAKRYFSRNWTPPKDLNQTLEYVVSVDAKGVVQTVSPLGGVARTYLPQSGIPPVGETLVSPLQGRDSANFRLVLSPDGSVLTFLAN